MATPMPAARVERHEITVAAHGESVERVIRAIRQTTDQILTLEEMAGIACMSPFHFNRVFQRTTGISPRVFQCALRMETAKRLLITTDMTPLDVCFECGYTSLGTFTRRFTEMVGWPPQRFRKLGRAVPDITAFLSASAFIPGSIGDRESTWGAQGFFTAAIQAPVAFRGVIFVAAFETPIPQGAPTACAVLNTSGYFRMGPVGDGLWHLMAAGIECDSMFGCVLHERVLRARLGPVCVKDGIVEGQTPELTLRSRRELDAPILLPLGVLFAMRQPSSPVHSIPVVAPRMTAFSF